MELYSLQNFLTGIKDPEKGKGRHSWDRDGETEQRAPRAEASSCTAVQLWAGLAPTCLQQRGGGWGRTHCKAPRNPWLGPQSLYVLPKSEGPLCIPPTMSPSLGEGARDLSASLYPFPSFVGEGGLCAPLAF